MRIWHRDGSLEAAVQRSRMRNLSMSAGVLVLLLVGGLMIIANAHRSRQLAKQQLDFVAAVTHELNTPIAAISSAGQNLSDGVVRGEEQVRRYGSMIEREGRRLASMVDQVLEFAGMQRASLPLSIRQVRLDELVDQAIASAAWMIEENEVTIERELPNHDAVVTCDRDELVRALTNLISNAIKYRGRCDRIAIAARLDSRVGEAVFSVSDEGLGVSGEDQTRIFEPFVRGSNIHDRAIRGSGLGLSIVRRIAHAHGGRVELKSRSGEGSVFSIHIPLR